MNRNIEWKAHARDPIRQHEIASQLADKPPEILHQTDTFFHAANGRLKLRQFDDQRGELIHYERENRVDAKLSQYTIVPTDRPALLTSALAAALGVIGVIRKRRHVYLTGQSRIHVDEVDGLGSFLEVEVVLRPDQSLDEGTKIAEHLRQELQVREEDLIDVAYIDMMLATYLQPSP